MTDETNPLAEVAGMIPNTPIAPAHGIAALALQMAMKYHGMTIVSDGALYQQYKLEGRNIREIGLADVFETAMQIEVHLLGSSKRIADLIVDALEVGAEVTVEGNVDRAYRHSPETCPSNHWNRGDDICADCGKDLNVDPGA